jgi:PAS domain S-box-containing protein
MPRRPRPELDPVQLRRIAELTVSALPTAQLTSADADSDELRRWHELQVSQIELDMQNTALLELQAERDQVEAGRDRYAMLYDQAPAGYLSLDVEGRVLRANHAAGELLACPREELPGKRFEQFVAPEAQATLRLFLRQLFEHGARAVLEVPLFDRRAGAVTGEPAEPRQVHIEANLDAEARRCRVILTDMGTADRREAARRRAFQVLDSIGEGVLVCDADNNIVSVNPAFTALTGYPVEEALGRNPRFLGRPGAHAAGYHAEAMRCLRAYGKWQGEVHNQRRDGTPYVAHMSLTVIRDEHGGINAFIGVFSDITARQQAEAALLQLSRELDARVVERTAALTEANLRLTQEVAERKRAEADLQESREQLRKLAEHLETVKEDERTRIARDIHDELGQNLMALRIDVSMLSARTGERHVRLHNRVEAVLENVDTTIRNVRGIMNELRPAVLDLGLQAALEWQAGEFRKRSGLACTLTLPSEPVFAAIKPEMEIVLFRALQEALSNVRRHAGASRVDIELAARNGRLRFRIADDGIGLAPQHRGKSESFGLIGMAQRVAALGGSLDLGLYVPGGGCTLTIDLDLA